MRDLPKITERYLMVRRRRQSDHFSQRDMENLLETLRRTRHFALKYQHSHGFGSEGRRKAEAFCDAIDDFAKELTGDRTYFWLPSPSYPSS
jgi:hypothetical protein